MVPFDARQGKQSGSKLAGEYPSRTTTVPSGNFLSFLVTNFVFSRPHGKKLRAARAAGLVSEKSTGPKGLFEG
jgi:hypothetical protein